MSGGPDSSALLVLAVAAGCEAEAIHIDHGLRPDSHEDVRIVAATAERLGVPWRSHRVEVATGPNLEARARAARHALLGPDALTGHTADDQAETILVNLLRGASTDGLSAMRPGHRHPLLGVRRHETHALCDAAGLEVVVDVTNDDRSLLRNRLRHELLPLLNEASQRDLVPVLARQAALLRDDADLLDELADAIDPTDARVLAAAPLPLARRAVRRWLTTDHPPDLATVDRVLGVARGESIACEVGGGRRVSRRQQRLRIDGVA